MSLEGPRPAAPDDTLHDLRLRAGHQAGRTLQGLRPDIIRDDLDDLDVVVLVTAVVAAADDDPLQGLRRARPTYDRSQLQRRRHSICRRRFQPHTARLLYLL